MLSNLLCRYLGLLGFPDGATLHHYIMPLFILNNSFALKSTLFNVNRAIPSLFNVFHGISYFILLFLTYLYCNFEVSFFQTDIAVSYVCFCYILTVYFILIGVFRPFMFNIITGILDLGLSFCFLFFFFHFCIPHVMS